MTGASELKSDVYVLGVCDSTRALLDHLREEAPTLLEGVRVLDARVSHDVDQLSRSGVSQARTVVCFDPRSLGWSPEALERALRSLCPGARIFVGSGSSQGCRPLRAPYAGVWRRIASWRFAALLGLGIVDALVLVVPLGSGAVVLGALVAPGWLRRLARFLERIADGR